MSDNDQKDLKELLELQRKRRRDRQQATTKRRRQGEVLPPPMLDLVTAYFRHDPEAVRKIEESKAMEAWPRYVGSAAARVSRVSRVQNGRVTVVVRDPAWMQQLSFLKHGIVQKYRADFPKLNVSDIFFTRYDNEKTFPNKSL